jgi:outer membrane protein assembly factor BamB
MRLPRRPRLATPLQHPQQLLLQLLLVLSFCCCCCSSSSQARAENWPQWRGPQWSGVSRETGLATQWGGDRNVAWRLDLPGAAGATPAVWEDKIFLTSVDNSDLLLICVGTDGKQRWKQKVGTGNASARGDEGNSASPSPCTDGRHVWSFMGTGDLGCYTLDGKKVWHINLEDRFGKFDIQFGMATTPVLHGGKLFFQLIHGSMRADVREEPATVVALDAATGATIWQTPRKTGAIQENRHSYASAILYNFGGLTRLITHGGDYTVAYDPESGKEAWRLGSYNPQDGPDFNPFLRFVASPGVGPGLVVCPTAKRGGVYAVRPDASGNIPLNGSAVRWSLEKGTPDVPTPLVHDGLVYLCDEVGVLRCVDAGSGRMYYEEPTHGRQRHRASPVYADGHVYVTARDGRVTVVKAGKTFDVVSQNDTREDQTATPAISGGTIYLRTFKALWAIRDEK